MHQRRVDGLPSRSPHWRRRRAADPDRAGGGELGSAPRRLHPGTTWLAFLGYAWTPWILTLARARRVRDGSASRPRPSRTVPRAVRGAPRLRSGLPAPPSALPAARCSAERSRASPAPSSARSAGTPSARDSPRHSDAIVPAAFLEDAVAIGGALADRERAAMRSVRRHHHRRRAGGPAARGPPDAGRA